MTPENDRWEGLELLGYWALLAGVIAAVLVIGAGVVELGKRILAVVWPWVQAHSDELTIGLAIAVVLAALLALIVEDRR
jgi:hypothetical protein